MRLIVYSRATIGSSAAGSEANEPLKAGEARKSLLSYATRLHRPSNGFDAFLRLDDGETN